MEINRKYRHLSCYTNLTHEYQVCLTRLIDTYGEYLNTPIHVGDSLFTLHDFNHHCYNLYRIISQFLCDLSIDPADTRYLSEHELFLLDLSVLFHDISMSTQLELGIDRARHSELSAKKLLDEWNEHSSCLYREGQKANLSINDIKTVAEIIKAHSDIKGPDAPKKNGIYAETLLEEMPSSGPQFVRAKFLAGILRLADELDITVERLGNSQLADQLDPNIPDQKASLEHWAALEYFSCLRGNKDCPTQLDLVVDDDTVSSKIDSGDEDTVLERIWNVREKIQREFSAIKKEIFQKTPSGRTVILIDSIGIASHLDAVNKYFKRREKEEDLIPVLSDEVPASSTTGSILLKDPVCKDISKSELDPPLEKKTGKQSNIYPQILSVDVQKRLDDFIIKQRLIESGHFLMNQEYCARDWVNTLSILEDQGLSESCIQVIAQHIQQQAQAAENTIILGLDLNGTLLGARIAAMLRYPFAFLIPFQKVATAGTPDQITDIEKFDHAIFVTDAVVTGATLKELIKHYGLQNKLLATYTMLYRRPVGAIGNAALQCDCPTYCISDTFQIEVVRKKDCQLVAKVGCIASNQVVK